MVEVASPDTLKIEPPREFDEGKHREEGDARLREQWRLASRVSPKDPPQPDAFLRASEQRRKLEREQMSAAREAVAGIAGTPGPPGSVNWTPLGPSALALGNGRASYSGRITALSVGPGGNRVYAGAANGGVWFSADAGHTWTPLDEFATSSPTAGLQADSQSTGSIAVKYGATASTDLVYVGTGEGSGGYDSYQGIGVQRSAAGGAAGSWSLEATNLAGTAISALVIDPDTPGLVVAGTGRGIFRRPTSGSVANWTQSTAGLTTPNAAVSDLVVAGSGSSKRYYAAVPSLNAVYSSPDATTWTAVGTLPGSAPAQRLALAVAESDPTVVYCYRDDGTLARLDAGAWHTVANTPPSGTMFITGQGWYDLVVAVDPSNANTVYLVGQAYAGLAMFKGTITGGPTSYSFGFTNTAQPYNDPTFVGSGIHPDGHAFAFALNAAGTAHDPTNVWVGNDGGVWQSTASGANHTWVPRNAGLAITEHSYMAQRADTDAVVFATSQDNGTERYIGESVWKFADGGDGGGIVMDQNNPARVMHQYAGGSGFWLDNSGTYHFSSCLSATTDGGASFAGVNWPPYTANTPEQRQAVANEPVGFVAPLATAPAGAAVSRVAFGSNRLWISDDWGASWVTLPTATNPYATPTPSSTQDVLDGNMVTAITMPTADLILAATYAQVFRFDRNTTTGAWTRTAITNTGLPGFHYITGLAMADVASGAFYATLGYTGSAHLYYFDGAAWHAALPTSQIDTPAQCVVVDPSNSAIVYVGTDVGCWKGVKTGATTWSWSVFSQGLPEVAIVDLKFHQPTRLLRAATHGRGVWEIPVDATAGQDPDIYLRVNYADSGRMAGGARFPFVEGAVDPTRTSARVYHWMSPDIKIRRGSLAGLPPVVYPVDDLDFAVNIGDYVDSDDIETADTTGADQIFVQVHNRSETPVAANAVRVALLLTDASAGLPPLPANYVANLNDLSTNSTAWLPASSPWKFANPPYRYLNGALDVRNPQVVQFDVTDLSTMFPGTEHVCAAAFVTTPADPILASDTDSLDDTTMHDKHVAHRNLHLVTAGTTPGTAPGSDSQPQPQTFLIDFNNVLASKSEIEMVFDKSAFPGELSVALPAHVHVDEGPALEGFVRHERIKLDRPIAHALGHWAERVSPLRVDVLKGLAGGDKPLPRLNRLREDRLRFRLDQLHLDHVFVAEPAKDISTISRVALDKDAALTAAITVAVPAEAKPGDQYRLDVIQRQDGRIVGGSTYVIAVTGEG